MAPEKAISGWGRYPTVTAKELLTEDLEAASQTATLSRGLGRSYGDASLPPDDTQPVLTTRLGDRILSFDPTSGVLRAEAGFSLEQLNLIFPQRGWATPVSPGTQYVTLGGMVASDVHGKNHHVAGCFGEHVRALRMRVADGRVLEVTNDNEPDLFRATIGGMGLTGHILDVEVQLKRIPSAWIWSENKQVHNLDDLVSELHAASQQWPYTVSWVDCLCRGKNMGRGIVIKGRWAEQSEAPPDLPVRRPRIPLPFEFPTWALNPLSVRLFNTFYYHYHGIRKQHGIVHPQSFFYPLDSVRNWNRMYGRHGFSQYQCVVPRTDENRVFRDLFETLTKRGGSSFLSVIKDCGPEGKGMLSFPKSGMSIALDIPLRGKRTQDLINALNEIVIQSGGRIYLTKDALTLPDHFRAMEPRLDAWNKIRRQWDPKGKLRSAQSVRLLGDGP